MSVIGESSLLVPVYVPDPIVSAKDINLSLQAVYDTLNEITREQRRIKLAILALETVPR